MSLARPLAIQAPATTAGAVLRHGRVTVEQLAVPPLGAGETLVAVELATVCGADRASARASSGPDRLLGHEGTGRVVATGEGATLRPGTRVTWAPTVTCGRCDRCRSGLSAACRMSRTLGEQPLDGPWPLSGTFARHLVLPRGATVVPVPDALCDPVAATAGCATATAMAALEEVGPLTGARVLVGGAGLVGLTVVAAAYDRGAASVVVADRDAARLTLARLFGATETVDPDGEIPDADVAIETTGSGALALAALGALTIGGRLVVVSSHAVAHAHDDEGADRETFAVGPRRVSSLHQTISGIAGSEPRHLDEAIAYLTEARERWPWEQLVSTAMPLGALPSLLAQPRTIAPRTAVQPRR